MKYYVYVIRLDKAVLKSRKFRLRNSDVKIDLPCFYVGQSCHSPETRFWQHKKGYKGNRFVKEFGLGLCPVAGSLSIFPASFPRHLDPNQIWEENPS